MGGVLAELVEHLERTVDSDEDITPEQVDKLSQGMAEAFDASKKVDESPSSKNDEIEEAESLLAQMMQFDPRVTKDDYYDPETASWDMEGLSDDYKLAQERQQQQQQQPSPSPPASVAAPQAAAPGHVKVGGKVLAYYKEEQKWYSAKILVAQGVEAFKVKWDEWDITTVIEKNKVKAAPPLEAGCTVRAYSAQDSSWFSGVVLKVVGDGTFAVKFDEHGTQAVLQANEVLPYAVYWAAPRQEGDPAPTVGEATQALWQEANYAAYHDVVVRKDNGDGTFTVKWDADGSSSSVQLAQIRTMKPRTSASFLEKGQQMKAVVQTVTSLGAFVDFGAQQSGFVHISRLADHKVDRPEDVASPGQEVDVWFIKEQENGKIDVSMSAKKAEQQPTMGRINAAGGVAAFLELGPEQWLAGKVANLMAFGAFVEIWPPNGGTKAMGMVHLSNIKTGYVEAIEDELQVEQDVRVRVIEVDTKLNRIALSMRPLS